MMLSCFMFDQRQLTRVEEGRRTLCVILRNSANSKLDTILSAHIWVSVIRHLFEILLSVCGIYYLCWYFSKTCNVFVFYVLSLSAAFLRSIPHAKLGIGDELKIDLRVLNTFENWRLSRFPVKWLIIMRGTIFYSRFWKLLTFFM